VCHEDRWECRVSAAEARGARRPHDGADRLRPGGAAGGRANEVQETLFERQHDGLKVLLFRDVLRRVADAGDATDEQQAVLNQAWNERDLLEFWAIQQERAKALRLLGVDAQLYSQQSMLDLLVKSIETRARRLEQAAVRAALPSAMAPAQPGGGVSDVEGGAP
jgi:hypothetical protein